MSGRTALRCALGDAAVFGEAEAASLLPVRDAVARAWLRDNGLVRTHPALGRIVVWADVLREIRGGNAPVEQPEPAKPKPIHVKLPRAGVTPRRR